MFFTFYFFFSVLSFLSYKYIEIWNLVFLMFICFICYKSKCVHIITVITFILIITFTLITSIVAHFILYLNPRITMETLKMRGFLNLSNSVSLLNSWTFQCVPSCAMFSPNPYQNFIPVSASTDPEWPIQSGKLIQATQRWKFIIQKKKKMRNQMKDCKNGIKNEIGKKNESKISSWENVMFFLFFTLKGITSYNGACLFQYNEFVLTSQIWSENITLKYPRVLSHFWLF